MSGDDGSRTIVVGVMGRSGSSAGGLALRGSAGVGGGSVVVGSVTGAGGPSAREGRGAGGTRASPAGGDRSPVSRSARITLDTASATQTIPSRPTRSRRVRSACSRRSRRNSSKPSVMAPWGHAIIPPATCGRLRITPARDEEAEHAGGQGLERALRGGTPRAARGAAGLPDQRAADLSHPAGAVALPHQHPGHLLRARGRVADLLARAEGGRAAAAGRNVHRTLRPAAPRYQRRAELGDVPRAAGN